MADHRSMGDRKDGLWGKDKDINPTPWRKGPFRNIAWRREHRLGSACPAALIDDPWTHWKESPYGCTREGTG